MKRLREQSFIVHLTAFLLIVLPSIPMYFAARSGDTGWLFVLLGLVVIGNILVLIAG